MSGRSIGTVVGGAIGFFTGFGVQGMQLGMAIGGVAGGLLMPDEIGVEDQFGPRLTDLKTTTSTYGSNINRIFGSYRLGGNIIWSDDISETTHVREEEVGKGGSESYDVTTYTYSINMAIAFCEGEVSGIKKIWADSVLIYDISAGGTTAAYQASEQLSGQLDIYLGTDTQEVNWLLQSYNPDSPAYRNVCYIVLNNFQLESYGNRIPNITAEIVSDGDYIYEEQDIGSYDYDTELNNISGYAISDNLIGPCLNDSQYFYNLETESDVSGSTGNFLIAKYNTTGLVDYASYDHNLTGSVDSSLASGDNFVASFSVNDFCGVYLFNTDLTIANTWTVYGDNDPSWLTPNRIAYTDGVLLIGARYSTGLSYIISSQKLVNCDSNTGNKDPRLDAFIQGTDLTDLKSESVICAGGGKICVFSQESVSSLGAVVRVWDLYSGNLLNTINCNSVTIGEHFSSAGSSTKLINNNILYSYYSDFTNKEGYLLKINLLTYTVISSITISYPSNFALSGSFGVFYKGIITSINTSVGWHSVKVKSGLSTNQTSIASICQQLMLYSGIELDEMDLTDISTTFTDGIVINNISSARSVISILQSVYFFDLIEKGFEITSKTRGSAPLKTIQYLGANSNTEIIHKKELLTELPKKVTFKYSNKYIDYLTSSQSSQRIDGSSDNNVSLELPLVLSDNKAKQLTEIYLYNSWTGKDSFQFDIALADNKILYPGDVVSIDYEDYIIDVRLSKITVTNNYILSCESILESSYTSTAEGQDTSEGFIAPNFGLPTPTNLVMFNAPTLSNTVLNSLGVYYVAGGQDENWRGCVVFKSKDNGLTYNDVGSILSEVAFGTVYSKLDYSGSQTGTDIDLTNTITVKLISGTLESITLEQLFNAGNYIKIGDEILQYQTATSLGDNEYELSVLLRGRRGTEWAIETHVDQERFIFLDPTLTQFDFSTLNTERYYKGVTFGTYLDEADIVKLTYDGTNLMPFSPINQTSNYETNSDLNIEWMRRDRYISGYMRILPMSEETESYNLYIYNSSMVLQRTELGLSSEIYLYTAANRLTDGFLGTKADTLYFEIAQVSAVVGEGYKSLFFKDSEDT